MIKRVKKFLYLTDEAISKLKSSNEFLRITDNSREKLSEFLETAIGGMNRNEWKILEIMLRNARDLLSPEEQDNFWPSIVREIESMLSVEKTPPVPESLIEQ